MDCPTCLNGLPSPKHSVPVADAKPDAAKPRGRRGKRGIVTYIETETARQLKVLAAQHDTTLQTLGVEAWHLLLERYGTRRTER